MKYAICTMAVLIVAGLLIIWLGPPKISERREELWRQSFVRAEQARGRGDHYSALEAYTNAAQMASSIDDWRGLLAVACGLEKLGRTDGPTVYGFNVVMSAMAAAERRKSPEGLRAVADAFTGLGASFASFALSRIGSEWEETGSAADGLRAAPARSSAAGC